MLESYAKDLLLPQAFFKCLERIFRDRQNSRVQGSSEVCEVVQAESLALREGLYWLCRHSAVNCSGGWMRYVIVLSAAPTTNGGVALHTLLELREANLNTPKEEGERRRSWLVRHLDTGTVIVHESRSWAWVSALETRLPIPMPPASLSDLASCCRAKLFICSPP